MSLYHMMNGVNPCTFWILPMLGKHPDEYPRFRDCFIEDPEHPEYDNHIHVYTRTGGGNREEYEAENEAMRQIDGFVHDFDDSADCTYASWIFEVPEKWRHDFAKIIDEKRGIKAVSKAYQDELRRVYPKLSDTFDSIFGNSEQ